MRVLSIAAASESVEDGAGAEEVDWAGEIFDGGVAEEDAEDVECVVPIVG